MRTLSELQKLAAEVSALERQADRARHVIDALRRQAPEGALQFIVDTTRAPDYVSSRDPVLEAARELAPLILTVAIARQELVAHEAMTNAVLKRAELGAFVQLGEAT